MSKEINKRALSYKTSKDLASTNPGNDQKNQESWENENDNSLRSQLLQIWKDLLNGKEVDTEKDFFNNGGTSIKLIQLLSKISTHFGIELSLEELFELNTIDQQLALISKKENKT